jgi:uncharacterized GH25 family protein
MPRITRSLIQSVAALCLTAGVLQAHDMCLRPAQHVARPNSTVLIRRLNGTFSRSENAITGDRLVDVAIVSPSGRTALDTALWSVAGDTSTFVLRTGASGTYVLGTSTRPRVLAMEAKDFNSDLADDGIPDELAARRREGRLHDASRERCHKHVNALVQVGDNPDSTYATVLGYPVEIVPLANPYARAVGGTLDVRIVADGKPLAGQYIQYGGRTERGARISQQSARSNRNGVARIPLRHKGAYYIKFIQMQRLSGDPDANDESRWSTLTFAIR